ncbi:MAG: hypothetical protein DLM69_12480 [Candidatus Chloroheliales bacterium]|nr:MAG: hypothetical protein DLM69_12480 [Chloroflexota bacterium]
MHISPRHKLATLLLVSSVALALLAQNARVSASRPEQSVSGVLGLTHLSGNNASALASATPVSCNGINFAPPISYPLSGNPTGVTLADFNNDGKLDLAATNASLNTVSVALNNGGGNFGSAQSFTVGYEPVAVTAGDFNLDGKLDLAVANYGVDNAGLAVLLGNGDGTFQPAQIYQTFGLPNSVAVGDFNRDGIPDIATGNTSGRHVSVFLGNGDGTFQAQRSLPTSAQISGVAVGDFNRDANLDIITVSYNDNLLVVFLGNGDGSFQAAQFFPAFGIWVVAGDFNNDGKLDTAVVSFDNSVGVLLGNGDGTFQAAQSYAVGTNPLTAVVADFNADGRLDIVTANSNSNNVSMLQGRGDGTFAAAVNFAVGSSPQDVAAGDLNGDGSSDLVTGNQGSNDVSVLLNLCNAPTLTPTVTGTPQSATSTPTSATTLTPTRVSTSTPTTAPTSTPAATNTSMPVTNTPLPTTSTPLPATSTPTATSTPAATNTAAPPTPTPLPLASATPTDCPNPFGDITGNIFYTAIHYLNCRGVINGTDTSHYTPAGTATRGQFAKIVALGFGLTLSTPVNGQTFTDVPPGYFAYVYIESGFHAGILSGFDPAGCAAHGATYPCYLPNVAITRGQLTKLVVLAGGYQPYTPIGGQDFSDVPPGYVFYVSIETAFHNNIINGYPDGTFRPSNNIRRDEMAQIVYEGIIHRP